MSRGTLKKMGISFGVFCFIFLLVAAERYHANAASVAAMNQVMQSASAGQNGSVEQMKPGVPAESTYAMLLALLSAAGVAVCFAKVKSKSRTIHRE
ncbi:MAG: hypothetical protein ACRYFS_23615 [Janthinobacterium lividum]